MRGTLPTLLIALALTLPMAANAQVYKWKDANGTTHFSETPPPQGVKYQSIHTSIGADQARTDDSDAANQDAANQDNAAGKQADANGKPSPQLERFCAQLQSNITLLKSSQSLQRMGSDGKTVAVNEQVRAQQLKQQQQRYDAYCKGTK